MLALACFFGGFIIGVGVSLVVVEVVLEDVILGVEVVVEVEVKVVGLWLWLGEGVAILAAVLIGLPSIGLLLSPIKKDAYIKNGLIIFIRL